ncbi:MAG: permease-like cell division protein FtsX [bacterium]
MFWITIKRAVRAGWVSFKRNGVVSSAAILATTITLCVITGLFLFHAVLDTTLATLEQKVDVSVYFTVSASEDKILKLRQTLESLPDVKSVSYTTSDEQVLAFRTRNAGDYLTIQALDELNQNPFGGFLSIKATDSSHYENIVAVLEGTDKKASQYGDIIEHINYNQNKEIIDRINRISDSANKLGIAIIVVFATISVLIMLTTIRLAIYLWREEIGIMRLVGASSGYTRAPFLVQGGLYGAVAWLIMLLITIPTVYMLGVRATSLIGINLFTYFMSHFFSLAFVVLLAGVFLGVLSSAFAIRKYLKV